VNTCTGHVERIEKIDRVRLQIAMDQAASEFVNALASALPPLDWRYTPQSGGNQIVGRVDRDWYPDLEAVARQWAQVFGLDKTVRTDYGTTEFVGTVDGTEVTVWYIEDPEKWYR